MTLDEAASNIGARVIYQPYGGAPREQGTITCVGDQYAYVLYKGGRYPKATYPCDLSLGWPD